MSYQTLMVHCEPGRSNAALLRVAADVARRLEAGVIGISMCQPMRVVYSEGTFPGDVFERDREQREQEIAAAEAEFRDAMTNGVRRVDWRSAVTDEPLASHLAGQARCADLVMVGTDPNASTFDQTRHLSIGEFVMQAGRPILLVPEMVDRVWLERVLVGWKDTREARRAIVDALPLLKRATQVSIVEVAHADDMAAVRARLADVIAWLACHGVAAQSFATPAAGEDAQRLQSFALEHGADLIVAGAYGHGRLREWVLGGVTRDLLLRAGRCTFVSH